MKAKQVKQIKNCILKGARQSCGKHNHDQLLGFLQGARQMVHALYMSGLMNFEDKELLWYSIDEEVSKMFLFLKMKPSQS